MAIAAPVTRLPKGLHKRLAPEGAVLSAEARHVYSTAHCRLFPSSARSGMSKRGKDMPLLPELVGLGFKPVFYRHVAPLALGSHNDLIIRAFTKVQDAP